ncbi:hypothetical protein N7456_006860 [Penicillium angulare]|uniref:PNPLA domain-containing protein n=1 Tax=Penicillium angulare TaxID=116970 RepID=A0A9W9FIE6_9EURO|nr:hypothetical protein N7456_006860 [Penicillium angulare]
MASWLDTARDASGWALVDNGRLETLVQSMSHPHSQFPALICFAGNGHRVKALRALFPHNNITRRGPSTLTRLHLSTESAKANYPVLFADCDIFRNAGVVDLAVHKRSDQKTQQYSIARRDSCSAAEVNCSVISRVVLPWTQILCLFVDSTEEMRVLQKLFCQPRHDLQVGSHPIAIRLRVLVVLTSQESSGSSEMAVVLSQDQSPQSLAPEICFLDLRNRHELSPVAAFEPLRRVILEKLNMARTEQGQQGSLFSAVHLAAFWKTNLESKMRTFDSPAFDCLELARRHFPSESNRSMHLLEFLTKVEEAHCDIENVSSFVASAFLMDAYPPGMHLFNPTHVFHELYLDDCLKAWTAHKGQDVNPSEFSDTVMSHFTGLFESIDLGKTSATLRRLTLKEFSQRWGGLYSTTSCFICLNRAPEHMLACRHAMCDNCVVIFGSKSPTAEYHYNVTECPLCACKTELAVRQIPPTKGPNILTLDGGGIRGLVQLGLLRSFEKRVGASFIRSIDYCAGTSVGGLNIMDLVFNRSSAERSFQRFPEFAEKIFEQPARKVQAWVLGLKGLLLNGKYDDRALEETLTAVLGAERRIFDVGTTSGIGSRVAIIVSRISDGKACVIANYRGVGRQKGESAYEFLMPRSHNENPLLRDVARCGVAAPGFFGVKKLPGFEPLQDGGVRANNPLSIALKECALIWPDKEKPDLVVSVGTGYVKATCRPDLAQPSGILRDGAVARLIRAFALSPSMDGEQAFLEALNYIASPMRANIYRVNQLLVEPLPWLDDVTALAKLAESSFIVPDELVQTILVTGSFFFELDKYPTMKQGAIFCEGSILCTNTQPGNLVSRILAEIPGAEFQTNRQAPLGLVAEDNGCSVCGYYRKKVSFTVNSLDETFTLQIANRSLRQRLGGFPKSVQKLLDEQKVYHCFGRPDHLSDTWPPIRQCFCRRGTKRRVSFVEPPLCKKRRRL